MSRQAGSVFITGATGFIGSNLTRFLLKKGYSVHILLRKNSDTSNIKDILKLLKIHKGSLSEKNKLEIILKKIKPSYIFHLSSYGNSSFQKELDKMIYVNILGLYNLLQASLKINYKSLIISGSSSEYGFKNKPMKESDLLEPNSYYSATKSAASLLAQSFAYKNNKPIIILRLFSVYGPHEENSRLIPTVIKKALRNEKIFVTKETVKRDFIFIDDVLEAFYKTMKSKLKNGEIINIGTGKQYSNKEIIKTVEKILNLKLRLGVFPQREWDSANWVANINKSKKMLKWTAKNNIEQGLIKTIKWQKENK